MATETIREFVASLGFKVDESTERRFVGAIEGATLRANLLADAIESLASTVVSKVGEVASQFEGLFFQSQRVGSSAASIRAFEFAVSRLGGTAQGASSTLENFGRWLRETPNSLGYLATQLHIQTKNIDGTTRDSSAMLLDIGEKLSHMPPFLARKYREILGIDEQTLLAIEHAPEAYKRYHDALTAEAGAGITGAAMKDAHEFENSWNGVWMRLGNLAEGGESKLFAALTDPMEKFSDWLDRNSPQINAAIGKMATSVGDLTEAWEHDLDKVKWSDVAKDFENGAAGVSHLATQLASLSLAIENDLPKIQALVGALVGARVGALFGPMGAAVGAGVGALAPGMIEQETNPNAPHAADTRGVWRGIGRWWGAHAPGWLGGGGSDARGVLQNGAPVSDSNPLAVKVTNADPSSGGGLLSSIGSAFSGAFGGIRHFFGGGGASPIIRARGGGGTPTGNELAYARQGYNYWRAQGLSHDQALAVIGNERGENALGSLARGDGGSASGQFQWHGDRRAAILKGTGIDVATAGFLDQQRAARWEMENGPGGGHIWEALKRAKTREEAVWLMVHGFERSADQRGDAALRLGYADRYGRALTGSPGSAIAAPIPNNWDKGPGWDSLNKSLPVGPSSSTDNSKTANVTVNNNVNVATPDPQSAAAMVGVHLNRTPADVARNLQGAF